MFQNVPTKAWNFDSHGSTTSSLCTSSMLTFSSNPSSSNISFHTMPKRHIQFSTLPGKDSPKKLTTIYENDELNSRHPSDNSKEPLRSYVPRKRGPDDYKITTRYIKTLKNKTGNVRIGDVNDFMSKAKEWIDEEKPSRFREMKRRVSDSRVVTQPRQRKDVNFMKKIAELHIKRTEKLMKPPNKNEKPAMRRMVEAEMWRQSHLLSEEEEREMEEDKFEPEEMEENQMVEQKLKEAKSAPGSKPERSLESKAEATEAKKTPSKLRISNKFRASQRRFHESYPDQPQVLTDDDIAPLPTISLSSEKTIRPSTPSSLPSTYRPKVAMSSAKKFLEICELEDSDEEKAKVKVSQCLPFSRNIVKD